MGFRVLLCFVVAVVAAWIPRDARADPMREGESILLVGGISLRSLEKYRFPGDRHDNWWLNFVRPARLRVQDLQGRYGRDIPITLLVYRPAYERRQREEGGRMIANIESIRTVYGVNLVWINSGDDVIRYINSGKPRSRTKIVNFEYFGHSNKFCFMLDYGSEILGASKAWLHEDMLSRIKGSAFHPQAHIRSWGCHTGESMSQKFQRATGRRMWGAVGKTDYSGGDENQMPFLSSPGGYWKF